MVALPSTFAADNAALPDHHDHDHDHDALASFFAGLDQIHLVSIKPPFPRGGRDFGRDVSRAADWARSENQAGANVYWTVNRVANGINKKPSKADIVAGRFAHVDIDPPKNGEAFDKGQILHRLADLDRPPSFIVDSGNGLQAFWRLDEDCENLEQVEAVNIAIRRAFNADACHNIDRLMRVPGLTNWPDDKKRARGRIPVDASIVEADDGVVYSLSELMASFSAESSLIDEADHAVASVEPKHVEAAIDHLPFCPPEWVRRLIEEVDPDGRYSGDRSAQSIGCARAMIEAGYSDSDIVAVLLSPGNAASAHIIGQSDPRRAAARAIANARQAAGRPDPGAVVIDFATLTAGAEEADVEMTPDARDTPEWLRTLSDGPIRSFVEAVTQSAMLPQPELALASALTMFGAVAGRRYEGPTGLRTNLYALGLCPSGMGKDAPLKAAEQALEIGNAANILGGAKIASDSGLMAAVERSPAILFALDEVTDFIHGMLDPKASSWKRSIATRLTELFSAANGTWRGQDQKGEARVAIVNPHVCLFGVTTKGELFSNVVNRTAFVRGTLPRFLFFDGDPMVEPNPSGGRRPNFDPCVGEAIRKIRALKSPTALPDGPSVIPALMSVAEARDAEEMRVGLFMDRLRESQSAIKDGDDSMSAVLQREVENASKIALVKAITDDPEAPEISLATFQWAHGIAARNTAMLRNLLDTQVAENPYQKFRMDVLAAIKKKRRQGATRTDLNDVFKRAAQARDKQGVLDDLIQSGEIIHERGQPNPKGGPVPQRYYHREHYRGF